MVSRVGELIMGEGLMIVQVFPIRQTMCFGSSFTLPTGCSLGILDSDLVQIHCYFLIWLHPDLSIVTKGSCESPVQTSLCCYLVKAECPMLQSPGLFLGESLFPLPSCQQGEERAYCRHSPWRSLKPTCFQYLQVSSVMSPAQMLSLEVEPS